MARISREVVVVMKSPQEGEPIRIEDSGQNGETIILDGASNKTLRISLSQVLHEYDPYYLLDLRFDIGPDLDHPTHRPKFEHVYLHVTSQAFKSSNAGVTFNDVQWTERVGKKLFQDTETAPWFGVGRRRSFVFTYDHLFKMRESAFEAHPQDEFALAAIRELKPYLKGQMLVFFRSFNTDQIESFRHRILSYSGVQPLQEYYWANGSPRFDGVREWDIDDVSSIRYEGHDVFHHFDHWYITYACGMIWDERHHRSQLNAIQHQRRDVRILRIPYSNNIIDEATSASNCYYVGFTDVTEEEVAMTNFHIGRTFAMQIHREDTHPSGQSATKQKPDWEATVIPQFPELEAPGNLTFLMRRFKGTSAVAFVDNETGGFSMKRQSAYFQPSNNTLSARRMLAALNNVYDGQSDRHDDLRRILQGQHPSHGQPFENLFQDLSLDNQERFKQLKSQLTKDQQGALLKLCKKETFAFLVGVPGSGKSYFIMILSQMLEVVGKKTLITCANDTAVDLLAARFEKAAPALKVIRYQGFKFDKLPTHEDKNTVVQDSERACQEIPYHEKSEAIARLIEYASQLSRRKESRIERAGAKHTSLMARCLQECGLDPTMQSEAPDKTTKRFRQIYLQGRTGSFDAPHYEKAFNGALEALQASILAKSSVVLTTPINAGDDFLTERFCPDIAIADDIAGSTEPESLVMWTNYIGKIGFFLGVGDEKQLRPEVRSLGVKRQDGKLINHFAASYRRSLLARRASLSDDMVMLNATLRMTKGLQEPSSELSYIKKLVSSESCALTNRPLSQSFLRYMRAEYSLAVSVPRLVLHIPHAVSQTNALKSRYNVYNIALALREVKRMLELRIFMPSNICIAMPYRNQASRYREAISQASHLEAWHGLGVQDVRVMTINSLVGDESELLILDFFTGSIRDADLRYGTLRDHRQLNLALTRAISAMIVVADLDAFTHTHAAPEDDWIKGIKQVFDYFRKEGTVVDVDKKSLTQELVNFDEAEAFASKISQ